MPVTTSNSDRYKRIFEKSPLAIVILDNKGKLLDVNDRLFDWLGYSKEEVLGKSLMRMPYLPKQSKLKVTQNFAKRIIGKKVDSYELEFISKSGERKIGIVTGTIIKDDSGKVIEDLVMIDDVTDRKKIEENLELKIEELKKMNKIMINRELRMVELKDKIKRMKGE